MGAKIIVLTDFIHDFYRDIEIEILNDGTISLTVCGFHLCNTNAYLILPFAELKGCRKIYKLFEEFREMFPCHPDEHNTGLIVTYSKAFDIWEIFFICTHFEGASFDDLINLQKFMVEFAGAFNMSVDSCGLEVWDTNSEFLVLSLAFHGLCNEDRKIPAWIRNEIYSQLTMHNLRLIF